MRAEEIVTVCSFDPEIDTSRISLDVFIEYMRERDSLDKISAAFTPSGPTRYVVREIPQSLWSWVEQAGSDGERDRSHVHGMDTAAI